MNTVRDMLETGELWLGAIPATWTLARASTVMKERRERCSDIEYEPLSVTKGGVVPQMESVALTMHNDNRKLAREGDFVINSRSDRKGSAGVARQDGSVSTIYQVWKLTGLDPAYCDRLLRSEQFQEEFYRMGKGIVADLWTTGSDEMKLIELPIPPLLEQRAIAKFLDRETTKIDALVEEQRKLIELLKEKRQALITHAVTKGLNPNVKMKDSGIEWLGEVPEHWDIRRLGHTCTFESGRAHEPYISEDGEHVCVNSRFVSTQGEKRKYCSVNLTPARINDILIVMSDLPNGRALAKAYYVDDSGSYAVNQRVCIVRTVSMLPKYVYYYIDRNIHFLKYDDGANQTHLSNSTFLMCPLLVPPEAEQMQIANHLDSATRTISELVASVELSTKLLVERRAALISAAVTGKIDVRDMIEEVVEA